MVNTTTFARYTRFSFHNSVPCNGTVVAMAYTLPLLVYSFVFFCYSCCNGTFVASLHNFYVYLLYARRHIHCHFRVLIAIVCFLLISDGIISSFASDPYSVPNGIERPYCIPITVLLGLTGTLV